MGRNQWSLGPELVVAQLAPWGAVGLLVTHQWDVASTSSSESDVNVTSGGNRRFSSVGTTAAATSIGPSAIRPSSTSSWGGGFELGNFWTYLDAAVTARAGFNLTRELGPVEDNDRDLFGVGWRAPRSSFFSYFTVGGRLVFRDLSIEGGTWQDRTDLHTEPLVGVAEVGLALPRLLDGLCSRRADARVQGAGGAPCVRADPPGVRVGTVSAGPVRRRSFKEAQSALGVDRDDTIEDPLIDDTENDP